MASSDGPVSAEYIAGVFDVSGGIDVSVANADRAVGYRFTPSLRISAPKYKMFFGMLDEFCEEYDIEYKLQPREDELVQWKVSRCDSIRNFLETVGPHLIYLSRKSKFVLNELLPAKQNNQTSSPEQFYRLAVGLEQNDSRRVENSHTKYNTEQLKQSWEVTDTPEIETFSFNTPDEISDEYAAGVLDAGARLTPLIQQEKSKPVGYSLTAMLIVSKCHNSSPFFELITQKLDSFDASPSHIRQGRKESVRVSHSENIEKVVNPLHEQFVLKYMGMREFIESVSPLLKNGEHHEDEVTFLRVLRKFRDIRLPCSKGRKPKYTTEYFCSEFELPESEVYGELGQG